MPEVDWLLIKTEYITTNLSLRQLADKHGVNRTTIGQRCKAEEWVEARRQHKDKILSKTTERIANKEANKLAKLAETTNKAIDVVAKAFDDKDQFNRYIVETLEEYAEPETIVDDDNVIHSVGMRKYSHEKTFAKVDTKALKDLTTVLKDLTGLMRNLYGIPTQVEAEQQRIAAERLELEKKKAALDENADKRIEVVFEGGDVEEWCN